MQLDLHTKGSKLRVTLNPEKEKETVKLTHTALDSLSMELGLSNNKVKKVNHLIRTQFGRNSVQPYHRSHLTKKGNFLFELYKFENITFKDSCNNLINRCLVFADAEDIIDRICDVRGYDYPGVVKVMIDGGQGFLKISLSVLPPGYDPLTDSVLKEDLDDSIEEAGNTELKVTHSPFMKGKLTSVSRLVILAIVPDIPESNSNLEILFNKSGINNISFRFCVDFKMLHVCLGIQNAVSTYPCPYCEITLNDIRDLEKVLNNEDFEGPNERTFGSLKEDFN